MPLSRHIVVLAKVASERLEYLLLLDQGCIRSHQIKDVHKLIWKEGQRLECLVLPHFVIRNSESKHFSHFTAALLHHMSVLYYCGNLVKLFNSRYKW